MAKQFASLEVKKQRGILVLLGNAQTPRGSKFIKDSVPIGPPGRDPKTTKAETKAAVEKLYTED